MAKNNNKNSQVSSDMSELKHKPSVPIAIVGMACLMPDAKQLEDYWGNIVNRLVSIVDVPNNRWDINDYYDANPKSEDKSYCKRGAFIPEIDFNPLEFGLPPNILEATDVSQLLSLVVAKDTLEDAGFSSDGPVDKERVGVVLGVGGGQKLSTTLSARLQYPVIDKILKNVGITREARKKIIEKYKSAYVPWEENSFPGLLGNVIAGRIANRFDLGGINTVVDAACASSFAAIKMAVDELSLGHTDMMLTGGLCTDNSIFMYMSFSKTPAFTPDELIKPFDDESKGMMVGEGIAMFALKRLEDATKDNDRIYAVIKGIGAASDGKCKSIYAPRDQGQALAINRAYKAANFKAETIGLIEAHGTGTLAGDVTEFSGLSAVFSSKAIAKQSIALGSIKSQIGHLKAAAGAAGLMKAALALHHKIIPPTASVAKPSERLNITDSPFYISSETRPWINSKKTRRRAGVSAFGFGGTNFHVALEEHQAEHENAYCLGDRTHIAVLSANSVVDLKDLLSTQILSLCDDIENNYNNFIELSSKDNLIDYKPRIGFCYNNKHEALDKLKKSLAIFEKNNKASWNISGIYFETKAIDINHKVVALFPGQGSQYVNMAKGLTCYYPQFRQAFSKVDALCKENKRSIISDQVYPIPVFSKEDKIAQENKLTQTNHAQAALAVVSSAMYKMLKTMGLQAKYFAGHSFGELTALWAAGLISEDDYYSLSLQRGKAMSESTLDDESSMLAVMSDVDGINTQLKAFPQIYLANVNSPNQLVVGGNKLQLEKFALRLAEINVKTRWLNVAVAFHTPYVNDANNLFSKAINQTKFNTSKAKVYTNVTARELSPDSKSISNNLKQHMLSPVLFKNQIEEIYRDGGRVFLEIGPKNVLSQFVKDCLHDKKDIAVISFDVNEQGPGNRQFQQAVMQCKVKGIKLDDSDHYALAKRVCHTAKKSKYAVKLSAAPYVGDATLSHFKDCLNDGFKITGDDLESSSSSVESTSDFSDLVKHQHELLKLHERFLDQPSTYMKTYLQCLQDMKQLENQQQSDALVKQLDLFQSHYERTLVLHEKFVKQQAEFNEAIIKSIGTPRFLSKASPSFISSEINDEYPQEKLDPVIDSQLQDKTQPIDRNNLVDSILSVVSDKTGYPVDMIDLDMEIEADLGIDSIKRVEILADIQSTFVDLPELDPDALSTITKLADIVDYLIKELPFEPSVQENSQGKAISSTNIDKSQVTDVDGIRTNVLQIFSDKTAYPVDMIDDDMDIEADLGIDSIKRVEILAAICDMYPDVYLDPEELSHLSKISDISQYLLNCFTRSGNEKETVLETISETKSSTSNKAERIDIISKQLLEIVADKTGYPEDMLDIEMDIESDLGIDSIKKVEIFADAAEKIEAINSLEADSLLELKTLKDVLNKIELQSDYSLHDLPSDNDSHFNVEALCLSESFVDDGHFLIEGTHLLLLDDASDLSAKLYEDLLLRNIDVSVLAYNKQSHKDRFNHSDYYQLNKIKEKKLRKILTKIVETKGEIDGVILFSTNLKAKNQRDFDCRAKETITLSFLLAKAFKNMFSVFEKECRKFFVGVTYINGQLGFTNTVLNNNDKSFDLSIHGAYMGLIKTLNREWPNIFCRVIDINNKINKSEASHLLIKEFNDQHIDCVEFGLDVNKRVSLKSKQQKLSVSKRKSESAHNENILVTGGARGITAECITALAKNNIGDFFILGRSELLNQYPSWAENSTNTDELKSLAIKHLKQSNKNVTPVIVEQLIKPIISSMEIKKCLSSIKKLGCEAYYYQCDITQEQSVESCLQEIKQNHGQISSLIHAAGIIEDQLIENKTLASLNKVFDTKVSGLNYILQNIDIEKLKAVMLFSSAAAFYGNVGQSDYAMANEVLNKKAYHLKETYDHLHVMSINWGPWDGGMVNESHKKYFTQKNIALLPIKEGADIFVQHFLQEYPHVQSLVAKNFA